MENTIDNRFDGLETKFNGLSTKFNSLETKFDGIEIKFDGLETKFGGLEKTNHQILDILLLMKAEFTNFKSETEEKFEFIIENAITRVELEQTIKKAIAPLATKEELLHLMDRFDVKLVDLKRDIVYAIRSLDKKFVGFAI